MEPSPAGMQLAVSRSNFFPGGADEEGGDDREVAQGPETLEHCGRAPGKGHADEQQRPQATQAKEKRKCPFFPPGIERLAETQLAGLRHGRSPMGDAWRLLQN